MNTQNIAKLAKMAISYLNSLKQPLPCDKTAQGKKWYTENEKQYQALQYINVTLGLGSTIEELEELTSTPTLKATIKQFKTSYIKSSKFFTESEIAFEQGKPYRRLHEMACNHENKVSDCTRRIERLYPLTESILKQLTEENTIEGSIIDAIYEIQQDQKEIHSKINFN